MITYFATGILLSLMFFVVAVLFKKYDLAEKVGFDYEDRQRIEFSFNCSVALSPLLWPFGAGFFGAAMLIILGVLIATHFPRLVEYCANLELKVKNRGGDNES